MARQRLAITRVEVYAPLAGNCLSRSLTLWWLLRRHGVAADVRLGVNLAEGFAAHAWVEWQGQVLNDTPDVSSRYQPLEAPRRSA